MLSSGHFHCSSVARSHASFSSSRGRVVLLFCGTKPRLLQLVSRSCGFALLWHEATPPSARLEVVWFCSSVARSHSSFSSSRGRVVLLFCGTKPLLLQLVSRSCGFALLWHEATPPSARLEVVWFCSSVARSHSFSSSQGRVVLLFCGTKPLLLQLVSRSCGFALLWHEATPPSARLEVVLFCSSVARSHSSFSSSRGRVVLLFCGTKPLLLQLVSRSCGFALLWHEATPPSARLKVVWFCSSVARSHSSFSSSQGRVVLLFCGTKPLLLQLVSRSCGFALLWHEATPPSARLEVVWFCSSVARSHSSFSSSQGRVVLLFCGTKPRLLQLVSRSCGFALLWHEATPSARLKVVWFCSSVARSHSFSSSQGRVVLLFCGTKPRLLQLVSRSCGFALLWHEATPSARLKVVWFCSSVARSHSFSSSQGRVVLLFCGTKPRLLQLVSRSCGFALLWHEATPPSARLKVVWFCSSVARSHASFSSSQGRVVLLFCGTKPLLQLVSRSCGFALLWHEATPPSARLEVVWFCSSVARSHSSFSSSQGRVVLLFCGTKPRLLQLVSRSCGFTLLWHEATPPSARLEVVWFCSSVARSHSSFSSSPGCVVLLFCGTKPLLLQLVSRSCGFALLWHEATPPSARLKVVWFSVGFCAAAARFCPLDLRRGSGDPLSLSLAPSAFTFHLIPLPHRGIQGFAST